MGSEYTRKDTELVEALMVLRDIGVTDLARQAGVQPEILKAWLRGHPSALAQRSYQTLLSYLGVNKNSFTGGHVQVWTLDVKNKFQKRQLQALRRIAPWISGGQMIEICGDYQPFFSKVRAYGIRGGDFRILIVLTGSMRKPPVITPSMLPGVTWRTNEDHNRVAATHVEHLYWHAVRNGAITSAEFDDIFDETFKQWSWNDLRLIARDRGLTPYDMAKWVLSRDSKESEGYAEEMDETALLKTDELDISEDLEQETPIFSTGELSTQARPNRRGETILVPVNIKSQNQN